MRYTRAYIHSLANNKMQAASTLLSLHNVAYMQQLTLGMREAIREQRFPAFVRAFMAVVHPDGCYPTWLVDALEYAGIPLRSSAATQVGSAGDGQA